MKNRRVLLAIALSWALSGTLALAAPSAPPTETAQLGGLLSLIPSNALHSIQFLAHYLDLSADQTATLATLVQQLRGTLGPLRQERQPLYQQLEAALGAARPDPATVGQLVIALHQNGQSIAAAFEAFDQSFSPILDPLQLIKYDLLKHAIDVLYQDIDRLILGDPPG